MRNERKKVIVLNSSFNPTEEESNKMRWHASSSYQIVILDDDYASLEELALNDDVYNSTYYAIRNLPQELELPLTAKLRILGLHELHKDIFGKEKYDDPPF